MNNLFSIFTDNSLANAVLMLLVLPVIIGVLGKYFDMLIQLLFEKKKDNLWKKTVIKNRNVKECIDSYKQLGSDNNFFLLYLYFGVLLGAFIPILITEICLKFTNCLFKIELLANYFTKDQLISLILPFTLLIFILVGLYILQFFVKNKIQYEKEDLLTYYNHVFNISLIAFSYNFMFLIFIFRYLFVLYSLRHSIDEYLYASAIMFIIGVVFLVTILYLLVLDFRDYNDKIKKYLNQKYERKYPYVHITTIGGNESKGQVTDIFDSNYLMLNNNGVEESVLWSSIEILRIHSELISENTLQKSIFDYDKLKE